MIIKLDDPLNDLGEDLDTRNMANETPERIKAALYEAGWAYDRLRETSDAKRKGLAVTGLDFTIGGYLVVADLAAFDAWAATARPAFIAKEADEAANGPPVLDIDELLGRFRPLRPEITPEPTSDHDPKAETVVGLHLSQRKAIDEAWAWIEGRIRRSEAVPMREVFARLRARCPDADEDEITREIDRRLAMTRYGIILPQ